MSNTKQSHPYHLVEPSPWPLVGSISALVLAIGAIMFMHKINFGEWVFGIGGFLVILTMFGWWRDVIREAEHEGHHNSFILIGLRYGMALFIASEVMFFVAWFWAFFDASIFADEAIQYSRVTFTGGEWPPKGVETFDPFHLPLLNTVI